MGRMFIAGTLTDEDIACCIADDADARIDAGSVVTPELYLSLDVDLDGCDLARDAVISACLKSLVARGADIHDAVNRLTREYPAWSGQISTAALLDHLVEQFDSPPEQVEFELPSDFGDRLADGRRRYQLVEKLGQGSGAGVYRAIDRQLADGDHAPEVAIKIKALSALGDIDSYQIQQEAVRARRVDHRHVARVLDVGIQESPACAYIVSEFISGGALAEWSEAQAGMDSGSIADTLEQLASGLEAIHAAWLVHCDLKPANILLREDGSLAISDFGLALKLTAADDDSACGFGGTPAYMPPEQFSAHGGLAASTLDIYAVGAIAWELALGAPPNGATPSELRMAHREPIGFTERVRRLCERGIDHDLASVIARCLQPDPAHRYPRAAELRDDLIAWRSRSPIAWTRPSRRRRAALWCRRHPVRAVGLIASFLTMVSAGGLVAVELDNRRHERIQSELRGEFRQALTDALSGAVRAHETTLPALSALEALQGVPVLGDVLRDVGGPDNRIRILRGAIADLEKRGQGECLQSLILSAQLSLLLVDDFEVHPDTHQLLEQTRARLLAVAGPEEPLVRDCEALQAANEVKGLWFLRRNQDSRRPLTRGVIERLRTAEATLLAANHEDEGASLAVRHIVRRALRHLYSKSLLHDLERFHAYPDPPTPPSDQALLASQYLRSN